MWQAHLIIVKMILVLFKGAIMIGQPLSTPSIADLGLNHSERIAVALSPFHENQIRLKPALVDIKSRLHNLFRELGTESGLIIPISIRNLRKCIQNFHPTISYLVSLRFDNLTTLDRHILNFLDGGKKIPGLKTYERVAKLFEKNRLLAFYKDWIEQESHVEIVTHHSDLIEYVRLGFYLGEVITRVLEIQISLLAEDYGLEAQIVNDFLDIMLTGNIPLGTYEGPAMRRTLLIVE